MRIAAIGDSFTEGMVDPGPDGQMRGWADRVAQGFAAARPDEEVWFANFAVRGRLLEPIAGEQLDAALALDPPPTHLTFNGGGNDMLRPGFQDDRIIGLYQHVLDRCAAAGVHVIFVTGADPSDRLPAGERIKRLSLRLGDIMIPMFAKRDGITFVDNFTAAEGRRAPYWAADRLHLSPTGHAWIASRVLTAMGVPTDPPDVPPDEPPRGGLLRRAGRAIAHVAVEVAYYAVFVLPWLLRRVVRLSSGRRRQPKYPRWVRVGADGEFQPV